MGKKRSNECDDTNDIHETELSTPSGNEIPMRNMTNEEEESVYVSVELTDFADYPIFHQHETLEIENIESEHPILRIGEYVLYGTYEDAIGTDLYYEMDPKSDTGPGSCKFVGTAKKRLKFAIDKNEKRSFLRKPAKI